MWLMTAVLSALFAGLTSILAKCGIRETDSDVATAIRTIIVLIFAWVMVWVVGSFPSLKGIQGRSLCFLILSGLATGASWICYFKALSIGDVNKVVTIDKSSTILTILLAIICFRETNQLGLRLICVALFGVGVFLMIEKRAAEGHPVDGRYIPYAMGAAVFAALTSILAKVGISGVESNAGTAIRTGVVLVMAWVVVILKRKLPLVKAVPRKELGFICLSGLATGASWLCYYNAIQNGVVSIVVPIDKMSILVTALFSYWVFREKLSNRAAWGLFLMATSALLMAIKG